MNRTIALSIAIILIVIGGGGVVINYVENAPQSQAQTTSSPDIFSQLAIWFWTNLSIIADLIILVAAILSSIGFLLRQFYLKPNMSIKPQVVKNFFGWTIKNNGHSRCYELAVGIRVVELNYSELCVSNLSLGRGHDVTVGFIQRRETSEPTFHFVMGEHPFVEGTDVRVRKTKDLPLKWDASFNVELEYSYKDSDTYTNRYRLQTSPTSISSMLTLED